MNRRQILPRLPARSGAAVPGQALAGDDTDLHAAPAVAVRRLYLRSDRNLCGIEAMPTAGTIPSTATPRNHIP